MGGQRPSAIVSIGARARSAAGVLIGLLLVLPSVALAEDPTTPGPMAGPQALTPPATQSHANVAVAAAVPAEGGDVGTHEWAEPILGRSEDPSGRALPDLRPMLLQLYDTAPQWQGQSVGTVGRTTLVVVTVANNGSADASGGSIAITVLDPFNRVVVSGSAAFGTILGGNTSLDVNWSGFSPTYSTEVTLQVVVSSDDGDAQPGNDAYQFGIDRGWGITRWLDTADSPTGWSGDLDDDKWHVTSSIEGDPAPQLHSPPTAWYHGTEQVVDKYPNNSNISLFTPVLDVSHFDSTYPVYLNWHWMGAMEQNVDYLELAISTDGGQRFEPLRENMTNATFDQSGLTWFRWISHWVDLDSDGLRDEGEYDVGLDISEFVGGSLQLRIRAISDAAFTEVGFYLDDFYLRGIEHKQEIRIESLAPLGTSHVGETEQLLLTVRSIGFSSPGAVTTTVQVRTASGTVIAQQAQTSTFSATETRTIDLDWDVAAAGEYAIEAQLVVSADDNAANNHLSRRIHASEGEATVLVVDDDAGPGNGGALGSDPVLDAEGAVTTALDSLAIPYDLSTVSRDGDGPDLEVLHPYGTVVWLTGQDGRGGTVAGSLTAADLAVLDTYLGEGGSLWLLSPELLFDRGTSSASFFRDRLGVDPTASQDDLGTPLVIDGSDQVPLGAGLSLASAPLAGVSDKTDGYIASGPGVGFLYQNTSLHTDTSPMVGIVVDDSWRVVSTPLDLRVISAGGDRQELARRVMALLGNGLQLHLDAATDLSIRAGGEVILEGEVTNTAPVTLEIDELALSGAPASWNATVTPAVSDGVPPTGILPSDSLPIEVHLQAPSGAALGTTLSVLVRLTVVDRAGWSEVPITLTVAPTAGVELQSDDPQASGAPGDSLVLPFRVRNSGNVEGDIALALEGAAKGWAALQRSSVTLPPQAETSLAVYVTLPTNKVVAGPYGLTLRATTEVDGIVAEATLDLVVGIEPRYQLVLLGAAPVAGGDLDPGGVPPAVNVTVSLRNDGNNPDEVTLSADGDFDDVHRWTLPTVRLTLPPFSGEVSTNLTIQAHAVARGGLYNLTITATSTDPQVVVGTTVVVRVLRPDLLVDRSSVASEGTVLAHSPVTLTALVRNMGTGRSAETSVEMTDSSGAVIATSDVPALEPGEAAQVRARWDDPPVGVSLVRAEVDPSHTLVDLDRVNDVAFGEVVARQANLHAGEIRYFHDGRVVSTAQAGQRLQVFGEVVNDGPYTLDVSKVTIAVLVDGKEVGRATGAVPKGTNIFLGVNWTATAGPHGISLVIDPDKEISEERIDDNEVDQQLLVESGGSLLLGLPGGSLTLVAVGASIGAIAVILYAVVTRPQTGGVRRTSPRATGDESDE